ncbi:MAG TPA: hypothetical protein VMM12_14250 [Longimicrobiales bacterium]|nr:hypothetical protein [Longimicrobiales bacterium]
MCRFHVATLSLALLAGPAAGQVIPIRTPPIVRADGFELLPSARLGMGGVSIAFQDTLGDPWSNPATGARVRGARVFGSAIAYGVSDRAGGGTALPVGAIAGSGQWFAAGALAIQSVEPGRVGGFTDPVLEAGGEGRERDARPSRESMYAYALLGRSWPERGLSVGGSVVAARRHAVDGIGLLYGESERVEATGAVATYRLGLLGEWSGARSFEAVAVHSRTRMTHDVLYADWFWDPDTQFPAWEPREERNADEADVWGLQVVHARPLTAGWRIGFLGTANRVVYPGVPRYDAPSDGVTDVEGGRGEAHAYNLGVGVAGDAGLMRLGLDLVYEPILSRIRGEDAAGTTVDNRMRYSNGIVRIGAGREWRSEGGPSVVDARLGVSARLVDYRLAQFDHRQAAGRNEHARWVEWGPAWGGGIRLGDVEVRYYASMLQGTERPLAWAPQFVDCNDVCLASVAILPGPAPDDRVDTRAVTVVTQQVFVSVPLGGVR